MLHAKQALAVFARGQALEFERDLAPCAFIPESLTGELTPPTAENSWALQRDDGSWLLDGALPVPDVKDRLGLQSVPDAHRARYHTVGGLVITLLGQMPVTGSRVEWEGWRFEVVDMDGTRIDKVLASRRD